MTNRVFNSGVGDWYDANSWTPAGIPVAGDSLILSSGTATISAADVAQYGTIDGEQLTFGGTAGDVAELDAAGASFGSDFSIVSTGTNGDALMELTGTNSFAGSLLAGAAGGSFTIELGQTITPSSLTLTGIAAINDGDTLNLDGGTFLENGTLVVNGGTLVIDAGTTLGGSGTIDIANGGAVDIVGSVPKGLTFDFLDATGTLDLSSPQVFFSSVTNFQKGDNIAFVGWPAQTVAYSASTSTVAVYQTQDGSPVVATFPLSVIPAQTPPSLVVGEDNQGGSFLTISAQRLWQGGTGGDWYNASNWSTSSAAFANSYPVAGDVVEIANGTAVITAADSLAYGILDNERIELTGNATGLVVTDGTLGGNLTVVLSAQDASATVDAAGTTTLSGAIGATGLNSKLSLTVTDAADAAGHLTVTSIGQINDSNESVLALSGWITNNGAINAVGPTTVTAGSTIDGTGFIKVGASAGGPGSGTTLTVDGNIGSSERVDLSAGNDRLNIGQGAGMAGQIQNFNATDTIDLQGIVANAATYNASSGVLSVTENGTVVASLNMAGAYVAQDFSVVSDQAGGSLITNTAPAAVSQTLIALPIPVEVAPGGTVSLVNLLDEAFGPGFLASDPKIAIYGLGPQDMTVFSYWNPQDPSITSWVVNGNTVTPDQLQPLTASEVANTYLVEGDQIITALTIAVATSFDSNGNVTGYTDYEVRDSDPQFSTAPTDGAPTPQDIVNAATALSAAYTDVPNVNDCYYIASAVAGAAGAVVGSTTGESNPSLNLASGFWRIAYAAGVTGPAVDNWGTLVQAGDILRVGWAAGAAHSFTVLGPVNSAGQIPVFDNGYSASGYSAIGTSDVSYWNETNPNQVTIYRLDPNGLYLVDGVTASHSLIQGNTYNDIILPQGSADTITTASSDNIIAGNAAVLNDATITDFCSADTIDVTGFDPTDASLDYDPLTGLLDLSGIDGSTTICLPTDLEGDWTVTNDGGSVNLDGDTLGTLYTALYGSLDMGAEINFVTCFATGTRIATPGGERPVEALQVGDMVCLADGRTQPISWIGRRAIDIARHRQPDRVLPVRIAAGAFGAGMPHRDLWLSPDHAVFMAGVLIPVKYLINGQSIRQLTCSEIAQVLYWHIELPHHDVLLAENLPVESYLDTGNRNSFSNSDQSIALFPDFSPLIWDARGCAPLCVTGPEVDNVRALLRAEAAPIRRRVAAIA